MLKTKYKSGVMKEGNLVEGDVSYDQSQVFSYESAMYSLIPSLTKNVERSSNECLKKKRSVRGRVLEIG